MPREMTDEELSRIVRALPAERKARLFAELIRSLGRARRSAAEAARDDIRRAYEARELPWSGEAAPMWRVAELIDSWLQERVAGMVDAEGVINEALRVMKERQISHREEAVAAITAKSMLESLVTGEEQILSQLATRAADARAARNPDLDGMLEGEAAEHQQTLENLRISLEEAASRQAKVLAAISEEESRFRAAVADALTMKAHVRGILLEEVVREHGLAAMVGPVTWTDALDAVEERIKQLAREAAAIAAMLGRR
jgi:phage shock protein A